MLVHLRLTVPPQLVDPVLALLVDNPVVTNLIRLPGACVEPPADLIEVDVAREAASSLLDDLAATGLDDAGGISLVPLTATPFRRAHEVEEAAAGDPDDAVVWDVIKAQAASGVRPTVTFHLFLVIAVMLAAIAVLTDSAILVVGAMVVGPEFATVAAICTGIVLGKKHLVANGIRLLVRSFAFAILVTAAVAWVGGLLGWIDAAMLLRPRPQTAFIWHPDGWSFAVAVLAGAAGVIALSAEKAQTMVGVFISVTTVPAAGNLALGLALGVPSEIGGSLSQLGLNIAGMLLAGTLTLLVQRFAWTRVDRASQVLFRANRRS